MQGIFHAGAQTASLSMPKKFFFLWVMWFTPIDTSSIPAQARSYPRVSFIPYQSNEDEPFGFIDPEHVIHGCHLIPAFCHHSIFNFYFLCIFLTLQPLLSFISLFNVSVILLSFTLSIAFDDFPHCYPLRLTTS